MRLSHRHGISSAVARKASIGRQAATGGQQASAAGPGAPRGGDVWVVTVHTSRLVEAVANLRCELDAVCSSKLQPAQMGVAAATGSLTSHQHCRQALNNRT